MNAEHTCAENEVTCILLCYVWEWVAEWKWREKEAEGEKEKEKETVLSYDERLDWLESDDCSKWPGRWLHLCFPFSPSLIPSSLTHLLSRLHLSPSMSVFVTPFPWFHHGSPSTECLSLSPNGTAISTNAFQTYSSCHITIWWKVHVPAISTVFILSFIQSRGSVPMCCTSSQPSLS